MTEAARKCPYCREAIPAWAMTCPHCGAVVVKLQPGGPEIPEAPPAAAVEALALPLFAGFWKRLAAALIDFGVLTVVLAGVDSGIGAWFAGLGMWSGLVPVWLYYALMESSALQGTLGKLALGIAVTDTAGRPVSFGRATARHFAKFLSAIPLGLGYLMVAFTAKKQGLHDLIAGTLVVNRPKARR